MLMTPAQLQGTLMAQHKYLPNNTDIHSMAVLYTYGTVASDFQNMCL